MDDLNKKKHFPLFVEAANKQVIIFGGGNIATRRCETLMLFDFEITVVAPQISNALSDFAASGKIKTLISPYEESQIKNQFMVLACTNDRGVNKQIGEVARAKNIFVSVCDRREECTFYFPAVATSEDATIGIVGSGNNHKAVKFAAQKIREVIKG